MSSQQEKGRDVPHDVRRAAAKSVRTEKKPLSTAERISIMMFGVMLVAGVALMVAILVLLFKGILFLLSAALNLLLASIPVLLIGGVVVLILMVLSSGSSSGASGSSGSSDGWLSDSRRSDYNPPNTYSGGNDPKGPG